MTAAADDDLRVRAAQPAVLGYSTASPSVSGTAADCTAAPDCGVGEASSMMAARNSSTCSGIPSTALMDRRYHLDRARSSSVPRWPR